jgi:hypothetical protein
MNKKIFILLSISVLLFFPSLGLSDCTDFSSATSWYVQDDNTIIYYSANRPVAKIVLQDCTVNSSSNIRFLKTYMCDSDSLLIDGEECSIMSVNSATSGSL